MGLELVFSRPSTLKKLRSGPLGSLLDGYCAWLLDLGFNRHTIWTHFEHISRLNEYLSRQRVAADHLLCSREIAEFFESYPSWCQCRGPLEAYLISAGQIPRGLPRHGEHRISGASKAVIPRCARGDSSEWRHGKRARSLLLIALLVSNGHVSTSRSRHRRTGKAKQGLLVWFP